MATTLSLRHLWGAARAWWCDATAGMDERLSLHPRLHGAMRLPGIRQVARRRADALFDLCAGFVYSQVLVACVQADLFSLLRARARDPSEIAARLNLSSDGADRLLQAATALKLLRRRRDGRYALGSLGAAAAADPGITAMVAHHHLLYADLSNPLAFFQNPDPMPSLSGFWPYEASPSGRCGGGTAYTTLMATSQAMVARQVLATVSFARSRKLLDLGGGDGTFLRVVVDANPHLRLALVELPPVAAQARDAFAAAGIEADVRDGDLRDAAFPPGVDIVSLIRVLHDHDDPTVRQILANVRGRLASGGTLLIAEPMADVPGAERVGNVYFPVYLKAMGRGRTRSPADYTRLLGEAGFEHVTSRVTPLPVVASLLLARCSSELHVSK